MSTSSSAYVSLYNNGRVLTYHFTGVISIEHTFSLNLDSDSTQGADIYNGARNMPNQIKMSVIETDVEHSAGWAARMLEAMRALKTSRALCSVTTTIGSYDNMLVSEIVATQNEENQYGWSGDITFVEHMSNGETGISSAKHNTNSSRQSNVGSAASKKLSDSDINQTLQRAGVA